MRGLCKIGCGEELEYESHEFSDGFVYYLPRNLDGVVHDCFVANHDQKKLEDGTFKNIFDCFRKNGIWKKDAEDILLNDEYRFEGLEDVYDENDIDMILNGKTDEAIKRLRFVLSEYPNPFGQGKTGYYDYELEIWFPTPADMNISSPTVWGYQLEHLGKLYEIITNFDDAKKCYDLQYKCTGELELLEKSKELDKKIKEQNETKLYTENISDNLKSENIRKMIESTELNIRKYVVELFSNNFTELFKKHPSLRDEIQKIRGKDEDSMLDFNENSDIETLSIGSLGYILRKSKGKTRSKTDQRCDICGKNWKKGQIIFLETFPKKIMCSNETCFVKQGGSVKNIPEDLIHRISNITKMRNIHDHPRDCDEEMFKKMLEEAYATCNVINYYIKKFLTTKQST